VAAFLCSMKQLPKLGGVFRYRYYIYWAKEFTAMSEFKATVIIHVVWTR